MRRAASVLALLVCATLVGPPPTASADAERGARQVPTRVVVERDRQDMTGVQFYFMDGRLDSPVRACAKNRRVTLTSVQTHERVLATRTGRRGRWSFAMDEGDAQGITMPVFKVSVARKVVRVAGHRVVCKAGSTTWSHNLVAIEGFDSPTFPDVVADGGIQTYGFARCVSGRKVTLRNVTRRTDLGTDRTDADGDWAVTFDAFATGSTDSDTYRAILAKKVVTWRDRRVICGSAVFTGTVDDVENPPVMKPARHPAASWVG